MKALIVLEHHFYKDQAGTVWCDRVVDYHFLERYLLSFDEIIVCGRMKEVSGEIDPKWIVASGPRVSFVGLPNFYGATATLKNIGVIRKIIFNTMQEVDCCILRIPSPISIVAFKAVKKAKKPIAAEMMMSAKKMFEAKDMVHKTINHFIHLYTKMICRSVNGVSYVTEHILQEEYPCTGFTTNYSSIALNDDDFSIPSWVTEESDSEITIINTGFMDTYRKGQHIVIKTIAELVKQGYNVKGILVGDGNKRDEFETLAKNENVYERITFTGALDKAHVFEHLKKSNMLVLPTESEGLPRSIIEAMAVGLVCVASDVDGIPELLQERFLVHSFEHMDYVKKVKALIDNPKEMKQISRENYKKASEYKEDVLNLRRKGFYDKLKSECVNK